MLLKSSSISFLTRLLGIRIYFSFFIKTFQKNTIREYSYQIYHVSFNLHRTKTKSRIHGLTPVTFVGVYRTLRINL